MYGACFFVLVAAAGFWTALLSTDLSLRYVAWHTAVNMPTIYKFSAFWAGRIGVLLFCALFLSCFGSLMIFANRGRERALMPWAAGILAALLVLFVAATALSANPFELLNYLPPDGRGLDPRWQNPLMLVQPPAVYIGFVAAAVPFAFAVPALITRRFDAAWVRAVHPWILASWVFLTIGIVLGVWWAYIEPASGVWAPDGLTRSAIVPWTACTAALCSLTIANMRGARAIAGAVAIAGVLMMAAALTGTAFAKHYTFTLGAGESATAVDAWGRTWTFTSQGVSKFPQLNRHVEAVALRAVREGEPQPLIRAEQRRYETATGQEHFNPSAEAGILQTPLQDVYVVLDATLPADRAQLRVAFNPLMIWWCWGGALLVVAGAVALRRV